METMNARETHEVTRKGETYRWVPCYKCLGAKVFECWLGIYNGVCFACGGAGGEYKTVKALERAEKRSAATRRRAAKKAEAARAKVDAKLTATMEATPELARVLTAAAGVVTDEDGERSNPELGGRTDRELLSLQDLASKLVGRGALTEKQTAFALKLSTPATCKRCGEQGHNERECPKRAEVEAGRQTITGKVVSEREEAAYVAWGYGTMKCLVVCDDGRKFWGTKPRCCTDDEYTPVYVGATVTFKATVERSSGDPHFGTYKRPSKATINEQGPEPEDER